MGEEFDYAKEFKSLDYQARQARPHRADDRQPAVVAGRLRPLRSVLHPHGLAQRRHLPHRRRPRRRLSGGQRFAPLNSWPDNGNLDKARRLLWPIKQKYGRKLSWADLMILAGNVAIESMGGPIFGFGGGRADVWEPEKDIYWGTEEEWVGRRDPHRARSRGAREPARGDPDGPHLRQSGRARAATPIRSQSARDIRETFARMGMNDEETVALTAGGHTFGKCHGAGDASKVGAEPEGADIAQQGLGWPAATRAAWATTPSPAASKARGRRRRSHGRMNYFHMLLDYEYELVRSPAGAQQWQPMNQKPEDMAPGAHSPDRRVPTMMTTADMAFKMDPEYRKISERFRDNPDQFADAFARAWFKLTHRDMGPKARYLGPEVPAEDLIWQDPIPAGTHARRRATSRASRRKIAGSGPQRRRAGQDGLGLGVDLPRLGQAGRRQWRAHPPRAAEGLGGQRAGQARAGAAGL